MAADRALLAEAAKGQTVCRLYSWNGPWVSLGRFQKAEDAVVPGFTRFVSRPTGGKAVLHGHDLTIALAAPFRGKAVKEAYRAALAPVLAALSRSGHGLHIANSSRAFAGAGADCFSSTSAFDLVDSRSGRKAAGAALRIDRAALLLQVSIPYCVPLVQPESAIVGGVEPPLLDWAWQSFAESLCTEFSQSIHIESATYPTDFLPSEGKLVGRR